MIDGLHDDADLRDKQYQYLIARLALRQHILEQSIRALYTFDKPKTDAERANAILSLDSSLQDAEDPGRVLAFVADHPELLPSSMK
jgi:hypothetical protein